MTKSNKIAFVELSVFGFIQANGSSQDETPDP